VSAPAQEDVRAFIVGHLAEVVGAQGGSLPDELGDDHDLLLSGLIDSLGLLELIGALEAYCGREIDFEALDPDEMTILGPLSRFVADEAARV
jgi:acyl carrier protein